MQDKGDRVNDLRAVVIVDYQNVHLVGHNLYDSTRLLPRHKTLVDPLLFAGHLLRERNAAQRPGMAGAVLRAVQVFSGQPSPTTTRTGTRAVSRSRPNGSATSASPSRCAR